MIHYVTENFSLIFFIKKSLKNYFIFLFFYKTKSLPKILPFVFKSSGKFPFCFSIKISLKKIMLFKTSKIAQKNFFVKTDLKKFL